MESKIVEHCAPTLAGLKTANMFNYKYSSADLLEQEIRNSNAVLNPKGVYVELLKMGP